MPDNYNVNRRIDNFGDFSNNKESEKEELEKVKRSFSKNSDRHQIPGNTKFKYNKVSRKMDDVSPDIVDDSIESIDELDNVQERLNSKNNISKFRDFN